MRRKTMYHVLLSAAFIGIGAPGPATAAQLRAWGSDSDGQVARVPKGDTYIAVAAGDAHSLALRADGVVVAWGQNDDGQCNVPAGTFRTIGAGAGFSLAIRTDGSLIAWGRDSDGLVTRTPAGRDYTAIDGGEAFAVALRADGSLVAWGNDRWGQVSGVPKGTGFTAVVAGDAHGVALRSDGSLSSWGHWAAIQDTPTRGPFTAIGAGGTSCVALRKDGSLAWWGSDAYDAGLARVPAGNDYTAVVAGYLHCLALKKDGSIVGWGAGTSSPGSPNWGQANAPAGRGYTALAAGLSCSLALTDETGSQPAPSLSKVERFWSPVLQRYFYTIVPAERDKLIKEYPKTWTYEGPAFLAAATPNAPGLAPVYRFWSLQGQGHFYTLDTAEKDLLITKYPKTWKFEGVAFYAYPEGAQPAASLPVFRFWRSKDGIHFYTIDPAERDRLLKESPQVYTFEGTAFYAFK